VPYKGSAANARSGPNDMNDPAIHPKGEYFYVASDQIHYAKSKVPGKGGGADLEIEFTPANYNSSKPVGVYRSQADDALFHELIHSLRMMHGVFNPIPMPKIGFQDEEEYLAMTCQNVYISARDKRETGLRGGNHMAPEVYQSRLNPSFLVPTPPLSV